MSTPVDDSHETALASKLGAPVQYNPADPDPDSFELYMRTAMVQEILVDLFTRAGRINGQYLDSPLASSEEFLKALQHAEFDRVVGILSHLGEWLEDLLKAIYAHLMNVRYVPLGAEPLPFPEPAPSVVGEEHPDA